MKIIRGIYNLKEHNLKQEFSQCVLTMGNFDGVHLGHQSLISKLKDMGRQCNLPTVVMIFEPQPIEFFSPDNAPARLTTFQEKYYYLEQLGVDYLLCIPFNQTIANLSADTFVQEWLINQLHAQYIIVGDDFRFGQHRQGNAELLSRYATHGFFELETLSSFAIDGLRVSSTMVRDALANSDFVLAEKLLGRRYSIRGKVIHGNALARQLGFPTANIHLHRQKAPLQGVYYVDVQNIETKQRYQGIANIGLRPTVDGKSTTLEVNIFDFNGNIYGQYLDVSFREKIRDEKKFSSLDALKQQIAQDICIARQISAKF